MAAPSQPTFLGFPAADLGALLEANIAILGARHGTPYEPGADNDCAIAPAAMRQASSGYAGLLDHYDFDLAAPLLGKTGARVVDCGDVEGNAHDGEANCAAITAATRAVLKAGASPVLLGGDDSVPIPFISAFEDAGPIWIVQIDAHLDWRDERNGVTMGWSSVMRRASEMPFVQGLVQIGLRGPGSARPAEVEDAVAWGSNLFPAAEIHANGIGQALARVPEGVNCVITLDCDGIDPAVMPGMIYPAPGGLSYTQAVQVIHGVGARGKLIGFDITELRPAQDPTGLASLTAFRLVTNAIGAIARSGRSY